MKALRLLLKTIALLGGVLLVLSVLLAVALWGLGTRGIPFTVQVAQHFLHDQLKVAEAEGGLLGPITLKGVVLETPGAHVEIDHVTLAYNPRELLSRRLHVTALDAGVVQVQLKATPPKPAQPINTHLPLGLLLDHLAVQKLELTPVDAPLITVDGINAQASWLGNAIRLDHLAFTESRSGPVQVQAKALLASKIITVQELKITGPAQLTGQGTLGLLGEKSQLAVTLKDARWPLTGAAQIKVPQLEATLTGVLTGAPLDIALTLRGALRTAIEQKDLGFDVDSALQLKTSGAHIERLGIVSSDGAGSLTAQGDAQWQPALKVDASADIKKLDPGVLLPEWKGQLNGHVEAKTEGTAAAPQVRFSADIRNSQLRGYPLSLDARGSAAVQGEKHLLQLDALKLTSGSAVLNAQGQVLPALDAKASVNAPDLHTLLPMLSGAVQFSGSALGPLTAPAVQAKGTLKNLRVQTLQITAADFDAQIDPAKDSNIKLSVSDVKQGNTQLQSASAVLAGRLEAHTLALKATLANPKTSASLQLQGRADIKAKRWQGQLQQSAFTPPYGPSWQQTAAAPLLLQATQQSLQAACWQAGSAKVCLDVNRTQPQANAVARTQAAAQITQLDVGQFAALMPKDWALKTVLDGSAKATLNGNTPELLDVDLRNSAGSLQIPKAPLLALKPGSLKLQQVGERWEARANLAVDQGSVVLDAAIPVAGDAFSARPISGNVALLLPDLSFVQPFVSGAQDIHGKAEAHFTLAGTAAAPRAQGTATVSEGRAKINALGIAITDITAKVEGSNADALAITASAVSGKGTLKINGTAKFPEGKPDIALHITGDNLQAADMADARVWVSPDLQFTQNADGLKLTGTVNVPKADITPRKIAGNAIGASSDQVLVGADAPKTQNLPLTARVTVALGDAVTFEGFGLKSRVEGAVTVLDEPGGGGTRGRGELRLVDAVYHAYGQELKLETGRILFNGGLLAEPTVDLRASRQPREGIQVALHVRGTLDQPTFDLSSSPPMPREQQLGWLLFGRPIDGGGQLSGAAAALSLGLAGGDALASRFGTLLGLDQVSLGAEADSTAWQPTDPNVTSTSAAEQTRFTVGKYLSPKLFVSYGVGLFQNGNVLRLIYDLGHGFKLRTESGLETGGDVLYTREH